MNVWGLDFLSDRTTSLPAHLEPRILIPHRVSVLLIFPDDIHPEE